MLKLRISLITLSNKSYALLFKVLRSDISGKKSLIQTLEANIEKLTEEIKLKQNILSLHTETVKRYNHLSLHMPSYKHISVIIQGWYVDLCSMKATNRRLQQYEQSMKEKAENQLDSYNQELWANFPFFCWIFSVFIQQS